MLLELEVGKVRKAVFTGTAQRNFTFTKNYIFTSPSLAAAIVMGRNANGRTEWKSTDQKTIKDFEESN